MNSDYDNVPDYVKIGMENAKKATLHPAPDPPVIAPKLSVKNKIRNLFCSVKNIVSDASNGKEVTVNDVNYNKRVNTCIECPYLSEDKNVCTQCGCFIKMKAKFKSSTCPKNYW
jgi:hypothetical protein